MAAIEEAIYSIGTNAAGLAALIADRLYLGETRSTVKPRVVWEKSEQQSVSGYWSDTGWYHTTVVFTAQADTSIQARDVMAQVRVAYQRFHGSAAGIEINDVLPPAGGGNAHAYYDPELACFCEELELVFSHGS
jgi:hypothetical protein